MIRAVMLVLSWLATAQAPAPQPVAVVLGDSITHLSSHVINMALDPTHQVHIVGEAGEGFGGGQDSYLDQPRRMVQWAVWHGAVTRPDVVVLALGTNDALDEDITLSETFNGVVDTFVQFPDACIVSMGIQDSPNLNRIEARLINTLLHAWSDVYVAPSFETVAHDGIHPTQPVGRIFFAESIRQGVTLCP